MLRRVSYAISILVIIVDQITKYLADTNLALYEKIAVMPMFNITLHYNEGAAFSFLDDAGGWQRWFFTSISTVVSIVLIVWIYRLAKEEKWLSLALSLILGGAVGNLIDRILHGHVIDFIQWYYDKWNFPTFNVADASIFCGAVLLFALSFFTKEAEQPET